MEQEIIIGHLFVIEDNGLQILVIVTNIRNGYVDIRSLTSNMTVKLTLDSFENKILSYNLISEDIKLEIIKLQSDMVKLLSGFLNF